MNRSARCTVLLAVTCTAACVTGSDRPDDVDDPLPDDVLTALQRDLGQTADEIAERLRAEAIAAQVEPALREQLGDMYGGA